MHGHFGENLKEEAERLIKYYEEKLKIKISFREATDIAALRSKSNLFHPDELKRAISKLRGI